MSDNEIDLAYDDMLTDITVIGAREHNLRNVNVKLPREKFVVITGLSGSGKSSLAFDTLYAEGQRRYVECLSSYARQFLGMMKKPAVDVLEGLSPAISIEQKTISHNPRSTVGTVTEIYDYLRLLYSKIGIQHCPDCAVPVIKKNIDQIIEEIYKEYTGTMVQILAPLVKGRKGAYMELFQSLQKQGFTRVRIDGMIETLREGMQVSRYKVHDIELIVDRCSVELAQAHRISESCELALNRGEGVMMILAEQDGKLYEKLFSIHNSCPSCGNSFEPLAPNMFSFNSHYGACPHCEGLGYTSDFIPELLVNDENLSLLDGALNILDKHENSLLWKQVEAFAKINDVDLSLPYKELTEDQKSILLYGSGNNQVTMKLRVGSGSSVSYSHKYIGLINILRHQYKSNALATAQVRTLEAYMREEVCTVCNGGRLKINNMNVFIGGKSIYETTSMDISKSKEHFADLNNVLSAREMKIAGVILKEIVSRLSFLEDVGLSYLTLNRSANTLSGGESQRIRLASQIGSQLVGIMYVLDEPSIGLHQHDNFKLIDSLKKLRDLGNTVIVVEHDKSMIESSDYLVDMGPGAGVHGGEVVLATDSEKFAKLSKKAIERSLTAQYLKNIRKIELPEQRNQPNGKYLTLKGASGNNLKNVDLNLPLGLLVCISGMSGSGKSTLINDTLFPLLSNYVYKPIHKPLAYESISGLEHIDKVIEIDQSPIGRTPRSNPATYTGLFTLVRDLFSQLPDSKIRGYKPGRFSYNVKGGRCEECEGAGLKKLEMNFLPDVYVTCDSCNGLRYNLETLQVKYKDKSIADVLDMTVEEALDFFSEIPKIKIKLQTLFDVGMGYIKIGQQSPTLSGGEAQRVKLATELSKIQTGKTIYLLDEPTTGLHFEDVRILLILLRKLVEKGNTVVIIEHNLDVIKCADWVIDLGPEGGSGGGMIIAEGTPEQVAEHKTSYTAKYLKEELELSAR